MNRVPASPLPIARLPFLDKRPVWSVMIPVYNCALFLPETLQSVLIQAPDPDLMQIEVVDDASTDADVEEIVRRVGKGRVGYYRQPQNVGSLHNFATCINRAQGELIHLLHGDDRVRPGFYSKIKSLFEKYPQAGAAFCRHYDIDSAGNTIADIVPEAEAEGILTDWLYRIAEKQRLQYVAKVVKREVYEKLGSFYGVTYGEDWEMWTRIARYYPVAYTPEVLAEYRKHIGSISHPVVDKGQSTKDIAKAIMLIEKHLPYDKKHLMDGAKKGCALYCIVKAEHIWKELRERGPAEAQVKLALSLHRSFKLYIRIVKFYIRLALSS